MTIAKFALLCASGLAGCSGQNGGMPFEANRNPLAMWHGAPSLYHSLYSFGQGGKTNDGSRPASSLRITAGVLYGTTPSGGSATKACALGCGTVFTITPSGTERVIYRFKGGSDGSSPTSGMIAIGGTQFGTTGSGGLGARCASGCGTLFAMDLNGAHERVLYSFRGGPNGSDPFSGVIAVGNVLYGATLYGGAYTPYCFQGCGTIFSAAADGSAEKVLYRFKGGSDGAAPLAQLTAARGSFYGVTMYGGDVTTLCPTGCGTVFRVDRAGIERVLYRFHDTRLRPDGAYPASALLWLNGNLYGTTLGGGAAGLGAIFSLNASNGKERVLHSFGNQKDDGIRPVAGLIPLNGALYGTTRNGGANGEGTVFKTTIDGVESVLYSFQGKPDGAMPEAHLSDGNGMLYGTTAWGGQTSEGTIFKLAP